MQIQRLRTETRYSEIVIHNGTVYLAGQLDEKHSAGVGQQTRETLAAIDAMLAEAGTDKSRILSVTIYLKDMDADYAAMNAVWDAWVPQGAAPARACVEAKLYSPDVLVEMTVIAALP
ncbi:RidA family protein [Pseudomonas sp. GCM10022186]|uniref:RidA family protein n=1 Tax=Pseudomonas sp. GCM10022186 TaxID=3252650 RepID=UPI0036200F19